MDWVRKLDVLSLEAYVCGACLLRGLRAAGAIHDCRSSEGRRIDAIVQTTRLARVGIGSGRFREMAFSTPQPRFERSDGHLFLSAELGGSDWPKESANKKQFQSMSNSKGLQARGNLSFIHLSHKPWPPGGWRSTSIRLCGVALPSNQFSP